MALINRQINPAQDVFRAERFVNVSQLDARRHDENNSDVIKKLQNNITLLQGCIVKEQLTPYFIPSTTAIHSCVIKGNKATKDISVLLQQNKFDVKAILSPTVPKGQERLRICLHSYNTKEDITTLVRLLKEFLTP